MTVEVLTPHRAAISSALYDNPVAASLLSILPLGAKRLR